jgi:hypothetical protein
MKLNPDQKLFIYSMGKRLRITAIFHGDDDANAYLERHSDEAVIACADPYVFIANKYDKGE